MYTSSTWSSYIVCVLAWVFFTYFTNLSYSSPFLSNGYNYKKEYIYSITCVKRPLSKIPKIGFQDRLLLNARQKYRKMLQESILQYFRPSLSYHLSARPLFCLFLSGRLRQVLLYVLNIVSKFHKVVIKITWSRDRISNKLQFLHKGQ